MSSISITIPVYARPIHPCEMRFVPPLLKIVTSNYINGDQPVTTNLNLTVHINGNDPCIRDFPASEDKSGKGIAISEGQYVVTESISNDTKVNDFEQFKLVANFSSECIGNIKPRETKTCTITNIFYNNPDIFDKFITAYQTDFSPLSSQTR